MIDAINDTKERRKRIILRAKEKRNSVTVKIVINKNAFGWKVKDIREKYERIFTPIYIST